MNDTLRKILQERIVIFDGAMGTEIQKRGVVLNGPVVDYLSIEDPQILEDIHLSYIDAGALVIETNTFNSNPIVLSDYGKEDDVYLLNKASLEVARSAVKKSGKKVFIAGSVGPLSISLSLGCRLSFDDVREGYRKQIEVLLKYGVDLVIFETVHDILNLKAGLLSLIDLLGRFDNLPAIVSFTPDKNGYLLSGHNITSAYLAIMDYDLIAVGVNCSFGASFLGRFLERLKDITKHPIFFMPNSKGFDETEDDPISFADVVEGFAKNGFVSIAGGCCGTDPSYIKELAKRLQGIKPFLPDPTKNIFAISHKKAVFDKSPIIVGERMNMLGSRAFKKAVEGDDEDEVLKIASSQLENGSDALDVSFICKDKKERLYFDRFFPLLSFRIKEPFVIDTTDIDIWEDALKISGGRIVLNSLNIYADESLLMKACKVIKRYGAVVIISLVNEKGMPLSLDDKMRVFEDVVGFVKRHGLSKDNVIIDPLVFPVASCGYNLAARDTLLSLERIKSRGFKTVLGISNVSFGITPKARGFLNKMFFELAVNYGVDLAIVNPSDLKLNWPDDKVKDMAFDILFNGRVDRIKEFDEIFRERKIETEVTIIEDPSELLSSSIIKAQGDVEKLLEKVLKIKKPLEIIDEIVVPAMEKVGFYFSNGSYIITDLLASAEYAKKVFEILSPLIERANSPRYRLLLATVKGDVHDIGKNLVRIVFETNGFEVIDLGTQVPCEVILDGVYRYKPDVVGLSGLLIRSLDYMEEVASVFESKGMKIPLILGGASVSEDFVERRIRKIYPNSFYAKDAVSGVRIALSALRI